MDVNGLGGLVAYTYQKALSQTGSPDQALSQALSASQAQIDDLSSLFSSTGSEDSQTALQALLGSSSPTASLSSLFSSPDGLSVSASVLAPDATAALVRYTYDQSQNPTASLSQALASGQQALLSSGLNLLA